MGVVIEDIRISNEFTASDTDYLLGNVGDKITIEVDVRAEESFVTADELDIDRILINVSPHKANLADTSGIIHCEQAIFQEYRVDDLVSLYDSVAVSTFAYYVIEKINDYTIRVSLTQGGSPVDFTGNPVDTSLPIDSYIYLSTDLTALTYRWNFVGNENAQTYNSIIDSQINSASIGGVDNTDTVTSHPMNFSVPVTNNIGSASVKGNGATTTGQRFTITHNTFITPFILAGGLQNLKDGIAPNWFDGGNALKYIVSVDVGRNINDPNFIQTIDFTTLDGNTGWYGENFNGGATNYTIDSVTYKRLDLSVIDAVELVTADQTIEIVVKNIIDTPFVNLSTEFALNFAIAPEDESDYQNNDKTIIENFYFDRGFNTVGSGAVAGDNLGTDVQVIKDVSALFVSSSEIKITATISIASAGVLDLLSRVGQEYFLWVAVQNHTLDTEDSDRVSLLADAEPFFIDTSDDGMITITNKFLKHYESDVVTEGSTSAQLRPEDDVLSYSQFSINRLGRETDDISISSVEVELIAKKTDGSEFTLESFEQSFTGTQIVNDSQFIEQTIDRVFQMPDNEQRKQIKINRRIDLDTTDLRYYEVYYPFLFRWEDWIALAGVNSDAFDTSEPNNGYNEEWHRYDTLSGWSICYRLKVTAIKNGTPLLYQKDTSFVTFDYLEDTDWTTETIDTLDADTLVSTAGLLQSPLRIKASKTYVGAGVLTTSDVEWVLRVEILEQGGISDIRYLSSVYDWTQYSWLKSTDASNLVTKTKVGSVFSAEADIDFSKLPQDAQFKVSARIYDKTVTFPPADAKLMEDGTIKETESGTIKILD